MKENSVSVYEDIISLPHHVSPHRPHMSMNDRAAQFAAFAALGSLETAMEAAMPEEEQYYYDDDGDL
ncbi:MAG: hypothetical protein J6K92_05170 [Oscillospiraceae bacterium]|nr:hypothetical protein [Oscillospiraceae bacterium]